MVKYNNIHKYTINLGSCIGVFRLHYNFNLNNEKTIPCRLKIEWGNNVYDTGFIGHASYNEELNLLGFPNVTAGQGIGFININKDQKDPVIALVTLYTPIEESLAKIRLECPICIKSDEYQEIYGTNFLNEIKENLDCIVFQKNNDVTWFNWDYYMYLVFGSYDIGRGPENLWLIGSIPYGALYYSHNLFEKWYFIKKLINSPFSYYLIPDHSYGEISQGRIIKIDCRPPTPPPMTTIEKIISKLDLTAPPMSSVANLISAGNYSEALQEWRNITLNRLRTIRFGYIRPRPSHIDIANTYWQTVAEFLVGRISAETYNQPNGLFLDIYGISGDPDSDSDINWLAKLSETIYENNEVNKIKSSYGTLFPLIVPIIYKYWAENDDIFGKKFRNIMVDFCLNQKRLMESIPTAERNCYNACWNPPFGGFPLWQADRIEYMMKSLAIFAKKQEYTPPIDSGPGSLTPPWLEVLESVGPLQSPLNSILISPEDLAIIALSLTQEHIQGVYNAYLNQGIFNQRVTGIGSLVLILCVFPEISFIPSTLKNDLESAFTNMLNNSIFNDGGFIEASFNYNVETAIKLQDVFSSIDTSLIDFDPTASNILSSKILLNTRMMESLRTPFLDLPIVGNNENSNPTNIWANQTIRNNWLNSKNPNINIYVYNPPRNIGNKNFTSTCFPYSGYYVQRKNWDWDSPYLFMVNNRPINAGGREMANSLSIEVHAYGRQLLVNGGTPPYSEYYLREEQRSDYEEINTYFGENSTYKTNTIIVDDLSQSKYTASVPNEAYGSTIQSKWHTSNEFDYMEGKYNYGYGPFRNYGSPTLYVDHTRKIIFLRNLNCWIVVDVLKNNSGVSRDYSQIWKFPPYGKGETIYNPNQVGPFCYGFTEEQVKHTILNPGNNEYGAIYTSDPNGPNLYVYQFSNASIQYESHYGLKDVSTSCSYRGWYSRYLGDAIPSVDMYASWSGSGNFIITSLLFPTTNDSPPEISYLNHLTHIGDPTKSSFEMVYGSKTIKFSASVDRQELTCGEVSGDCEMLLTINDNGMALNSNGLKMGQSAVSNTAGDFEFNFTSNNIVKTSGISSPNNFYWTEDSNGISPNYI